VFLEHVLSEDRAGVGAAFASALEPGTLAFECRIRRAPEGAIRWNAARGRTSYDAAGLAIGMAGVVIDMTDTKSLRA
jgi:PAS domain-containing protein